MTQRMIKIIVSCLLFIGIIGSSVVFVFADEDISSLLTNWFQQKTSSIISDLDEEIEQEQKSQALRIEEELTELVKDAEDDLIQFTEKEKQKRIKQLKEYADEIIQSFEVDPRDDMDEMITEFDAILEKAKEEMEEFAESQLDEKSNDNE